MSTFQVAPKRRKAACITASRTGHPTWPDGMLSVAACPLPIAYAISQLGGAGVAKGPTKPWHDWRNDARELAIVVIGVLIALLAQQVVQSWEWKAKVAAAERAMRHEMLWDNGPQLYQRAVMHPCAVQRLGAIRAAVETGSPRAQVRALIDSYWIPYFSYDSIARDAANTSDVASHMPANTMDLYAIVYTQMPPMSRDSEREAADLAQLRALNRSGGALSAAERDKILSAVEALRSDDNLMWMVSGWTMPKLRELGPLDADRVGDMLADARGHYGDCIKPLPTNFPDRAAHE